jgi:hypothetical protein
MFRRLRPHLTYANVVSTLCLFLVLGGGAVAATRITGREIVNGSVGSVDLRNNGVRGKDVTNGTITTRDVRDESLLSRDFRPGSLPAGPAGPEGQRGADGSPDTAEQVRSKLQTVDGPGSGIDSDLLDGQDGSDFVADADNAGGDLSGTFSNLQIAPRTIGRSELASGAQQGCCVFSDFEYQVPANGCHIKLLAHDEANLGEIFLAYPESADLGSGVYLRPTLVAHPGQVIFEICNATGMAVTIPFGTFFQTRLIG